MDDPKSKIGQYSGKAVQTYRYGKWFDSKLECKWADALTRYGIRWWRDRVYAQSNDDNFVWYPDFEFGENAPYTLLEIKPSSFDIKASINYYRRFIKSKSQGIILIAMGHPENKANNSAVLLSSKGCVFNRCSELIPWLWMLYGEGDPPMALTAL